MTVMSYPDVVPLDIGNDTSAVGSVSMHVCVLGGRGEISEKEIECMEQTSQID